eukprot:7391619-Prymnesium_polylepis.5
MAQSLHYQSTELKDEEKCQLNYGTFPHDALLQAKTPEIYFINGGHGCGVKNACTNNFSNYDNKSIYECTQGPSHEVLGAQELWFYMNNSKIPGAGRGIFTRRKFKKGEVVMSAPLLLFDDDEINKNGTISRYCGHLREEKKNFLCFDYQGLCNTAPTKSKNNVRAVWRIAEDISQYVALRDIHVGEEILQDYGSASRLS